MSDRTPHSASRDQAAPETDPSMEDILASIRRILSEDEAAGTHAAAGSAESLVEHGKAGQIEDPPILDLNEFMIAGPEHVQPAPKAHSTEVTVPASTQDAVSRGSFKATMAQSGETARMDTADSHEAAISSTETAHQTSAVRPELVAPEAAAAAASSVGTLLRTLSAERQNVAVRPGGPTIEEIVREEVRGMLKQWLDANLAPLVERLVRSEIERVVGRAAS